MTLPNVVPIYNVSLPSVSSPIFPNLILPPAYIFITIPLFSPSHIFLFSPQLISIHLHLTSSHLLSFHLPSTYLLSPPPLVSSPFIYAGLYLNVAKRSSSHDSMGNNCTSSSSSSSHSNGASKHPVENRRLGKIYLDPNAAPYSTIRGNQPVHIHPSSVLFSNPSGRKLPEYVVFAELLITTKHYMRNVTAVEGSWLMELAPNLFKRAIEAK